MPDTAKRAAWLATARSQAATSWQPAAVAMLNEGHKLKKTERRLVVGLCAAEHHIDGCFRAFEGEAFVLQCFALFQNMNCRFRVDAIQTVLAGFIQDVATTGFAGS